MAGFIVETTNVHLHEDFIQPCSRFLVKRNPAIHPHRWRIGQTYRKVITFPLFEGNTLSCIQSAISSGWATWSGTFLSPDKDILQRKIEEFHINIFLLHLRFRANGPFSDVIPICAFRVHSPFRHQGKVFIIRQKPVIGTKFRRLFIERLLDQ